MKTKQTGKYERAPSGFIRRLIQYPNAPDTASPVYNQKIPLKMVQFWDDLDRLPDDVKECMDTWEALDDQGIERELFDRQKAREFIDRKYGSRYLQAYDKCYHPAMESDYFRLCYILAEGGFYIDADDIFLGAPVRHLFDDGRLKIQPYCYHTRTTGDVPQSVFTKPGADHADWRFYFNINPIIAPSGHPLIERELAHATATLESSPRGEPDIHWTAGPSIMTKIIYDAIIEDPEMEHTILILSDWQKISVSKWFLSYRDDSRNWRLANCRHTD